MKIYTKLVLDMETLQIVESQSYDYSGIVVLAKGGNSKQEMNRADQLQQQQLDLQNRMFGLQQQQIGMVNPTIQSIIQQGGLTPQAEAAMRTQALQGLGQQYAGMEGQLAQQLAARGITGGNMAGGGQIASQFGQLGAMEAGQQSNLLNNIQLAKQQGLYQAMGTALGIGSQYGSQATAAGGQSVGALGAGVNAAQSADQATTGFWGSLMGGLAGLGSAGIGKIPCWVAAELYGGWYAPETVSIRAWLFNTWYMRPFAIFYSLTGERWAQAIRKHPILRAMTKRLFDVFLRESHG